MSSYLSKNVEENLSKNLALMMQKRALAGFEPSFTSIDRNKIFKNNPFTKCVKQDGTASKVEFYNPLLSLSPLNSQKEVEEEAQAERVEV
jgi:hypothetical protein